MPDRHERVQTDFSYNSDTGHPLAKGLIAGAALGAGLGLLFAPRKGSDVRHQLSTTCHDAYGACRDAVKKGAETSGRYVRRVTDTMRRRTGSPPTAVPDSARADVISTHI